MCMTRPSSFFFFFLPHFRSTHTAGYICRTDPLNSQSAMSVPSVGSRNPFVPPQSSLTFAAASSYASQALTFNVLFSIMDRSRLEQPSAAASSESDRHHHQHHPSPAWPAPLPEHPAGLPDSSIEAPAPASSSHFLASVGHSLAAFSLDPHLLAAASNCCPLCLQDYRPADTLCLLPCHSSHFFHHHCLSNWFIQYPTCPLCRTKFSAPN